MFRAKDKYLHQSCKIYTFGYPCGKFISLNVEVRWNERNNPMKKVNLPKHVKDKIDQIFNWSISSKEQVSAKSICVLLHCCRKICSYITTLAQ